MWAKGEAVRPVAAFARLDHKVLDRVESRLSSDDDEADDDDLLDEAFERFEQTQPALANHVTTALSRPLDDNALGLGYFLAIALWLTFDEQFGPRLRTVDGDALRATDESIALEEALRAENTRDPATVDDVIAQQQPAAAAFIHAHVEAALDSEPGVPASVRDVDSVYRLALVVLLSLSYAVLPDEALPVTASCEILA